jgi:alpha-ketoglutarate-dependent taurine dioxygenase
MIEEPVAIKHRMLHSNFVAEVDERVDQILDDPIAIDQLKQLWQQAPVLIFRRQSLQESEQVRLTELFGHCESSSRKDIESPYHPEIIYFSTLKYADGRFVGGFAGGDDVDWHSDQTYRARPATGAMLYGVEVPMDGGDIYWANQYGAWDKLPADIKQLIEGKTGVYKYSKRYDIMKTLELKDQDSPQLKAMMALPDALHRVVLTHPVTGRKALYADPTTLVEIQGLTTAENERILPILFEAGGSPELVYRHKCFAGDLMFWDNGCTMHRRDEMSLEQPRLMKRTTFRLSAAEYIVPHA